uniref:Uncharacterized protein n=1 Tax=Solanum tuberosum TaxID=4113 RepID=M1DTZ0_SOLTU
MIPTRYVRSHSVGLVHPCAKHDSIQKIGLHLLMMQTQVTRIITQHLVDPVEHLESVGESICIPKDSFCFAFSNSLSLISKKILGKVGAKNQNDATDKGTDVEQYQGDAREIINAKFQSKSNKEEHQQLVPDDNSGEGRDSRNNLGVVRDATVDRAVANSFEEATTFNSNNEENLENKGKLIEAARLGVGKPDQGFAWCQQWFSNASHSLISKKILGKVGAKNQNDATDKGTDVEQYQGDAREIINAKFQSKSNKEEHQQLVPDDNSGEGRDSRNNLGVVRDATVDRAVANSFEEATTFNSNNEENLENKGKLIEAARLGVGKDGVLGSPNVVAAKQDYSIAENSNNEWTLVSHKKNGVSKS